MESIKVEIENCYGINKLTYSFDFSKKRIYSIYSPNGIMKTSFATVFYDYSKGIASKDLMYPERKAIRKISHDNDIELDKDTVFVIKPYDRSYKSEKISTLLVNENLRIKYDNIHKKLDEKKDSLINDLKEPSGIKKDIEEIISETFIADKNSFYKALERIEKEVMDNTAPEFTNIKYSDIFDEKIIQFLETGDFKEQITKYITKYDELLNKAVYLKKGFNHYNATTIQKNLKENGFFKAEHSINLNKSGVKREITNEKELLAIINEEKEKILNDKELKDIFENIDKKITNAQLREFREYLFEHKELLAELSNRLLKKDHFSVKSS